MKRDEQIDSLKGIAIILVVVGHIVQARNPASEIVTMIYSFHMPLFFMISGIFAMHGCLKKDLINIFYPFFTINIAMLVYRSLTSHYAFKDAFLSFVWCGQNSGDVFFGNIVSIGISWFLIALLLAKILFRYLNTFKFLIKYLFVIFFTFIGVYAPHYLNSPFCIAQSFIILAYMFVGYNFYDRLKKTNNYFIFLTIFVWLILFKLNPVYISYSSGNIGNPLFAFTFAISAVISLYLIVRIFKLYKSRILNWCGVNSLYIFCAHAIIVEPSQDILAKGSIECSICIFVTSFLLAPFLRLFFIRTKRLS